MSATEIAFKALKSAGIHSPCRKAIEVVAAAVARLEAVKKVQS